MRRFLFFVLFLGMLALCVLYPLYTLAEATGVIHTGFNDYLTPEEFASFTGQVVFAVLVVQFIKLPIDQRIGKVKTEYIVYGIALIAQVLAQALLGGLNSFTWAFIPKCIAYAFLVAVTAKEVYVKAIGNVEAKKAALFRQEKETATEK